MSAQSGELNQFAANLEDLGSKNHKKWFPLESNPEVMTTYCARLGLDVEKVQFVDVLSTDDWALDMVPQPVLGVLMVFPIKPISEQHRADEKAKVEAEGQEISSNLWYTKQFVGNACGTIGLLHAMANARQSSHLVLKDGSFLERFFQKTKEMTPHDKGLLLEEDEEIEEGHVAAAATGQSAVIQDVNSHFVCFSHLDNCLYELDGRKAFPINHGACTQESLLSRSCDVVREFMARDPEELGFTLVALCGV